MMRVGSACEWEGGDGESADKFLKSGFRYKGVFPKDITKLMVENKRVLRRPKTMPPTRIMLGFAFVFVILSSIDYSLYFVYIESSRYILFFVALYSAFAQRGLAFRGKGDLG